MTILGILAVAAVSFLLGYWVKVDIYRERIAAEQKEKREMQTMYSRELENCKKEMREIGIMLHGYRTERDEHNGKV